MDWIADPQIWIALSTLTVLEIVLGIDNVIFISILAGKLPKEQQGSARNIGLMMAMVTRVLLLLSLSWIMELTDPLFTIPIMGRGMSGRDLILFFGGIFLLFKSVREIHHKLEGSDESAPTTQAARFSAIVLQIAILDIVFSLDSVITAVGMVDQIGVMIAAVVLAMFVMLAAAKGISEFVDRHPTVKILALSFLILIGVALIADGLGHHIPKGYVYFPMAFSVGVEILNLRMRKVTDKPVPIHKTYSDF
jgi:predicted tellurium resistance membrane protein TerC